MDNFYGNALRQLIEKPDSYTESPGYKARLDRALQAASRANSGMLGSGNYAIAMMEAAQGAVADDYDREFTRLAHLADSERDGGLARDRLDLEGEIQRGNLGLGYYRATNDRDLGMENADNTARGQWYDYSLGKERNAIAAADSRNRFNIDSARMPLEWYNARTQRGTARSADWLRGDESSREWRKLNPPRTYF